jgi:ABC-type sulfate transport system substrate-binding protein
MRLINRRTIVAAGAAALAAVTGGGTAHAQAKLLNVSYDPTRELYQDGSTTGTTW